MVVQDTESTMRMNHLYLPLKQDKFFYVDDLFNGPHWKVIEHFGHRHLWDIPETDADDVTMVQDTESTIVDIAVELPEIDMLTWNWPNISSNVVTYDVETIWNNKSSIKDDEFDMLGEEDET